MIVTSLGHGYVSKYLLKEIASNGVICIGVTDNYKNYKKEYIENMSILPRSMTKKSIKKSTHLLVTAPPYKNKCPILSKYKETIIKSNIRSILYVSSTGVYGDHKGKWVSENTALKEEKRTANKNRIKAEESWLAFSKKNFLLINIVRLGGIYGPDRPKLNKEIYKDIIIKKDHYFSRINVLDISRLIVNILFNSNKNNYWNLVDDLPSTRKNFMERIIKLKKVKDYNFKNYEELKDEISDTRKKFWEANKKVSNKKVKKSFRYNFLFPSYLSGLKYIIKNLQQSQ